MTTRPVRSIFADFRRVGITWSAWLYPETAPHKTSGASPESAGILVRYSDDRNKAELMGIYDDSMSYVWNGKYWVGIEIFSRVGMTTIPCGEPYSKFLNQEWSGSSAVSGYNNTKLSCGRRERASNEPRRK